MADVKPMARIYYLLIKDGEYTIDQVPQCWRDAVRALLDAEKK